MLSSELPAFYLLPAQNDAEINHGVYVYVLFERYR